MKSQGYKRQLSRRRGMVILWASIALFFSMVTSTAHAQFGTQGKPALPALTSFNDTVGDHLIFVGSDFHIHQLLCPLGFNCNSAPSWSKQDLTQMAGAGTTFGGSGTALSGQITSFHDTNGEHVFFVDIDGLIEHLLSPDGVSWSRQNLSVGGFCCGLSGYSANGEGTDASWLYARVFYETTDRHVHMSVSVNGGPFQDSDLTINTGLHLAAGDTKFTSFHDSSGEHVFYVGDDSHLHELYGYWTTRTYYICNPLTRMCGPVSMTVLNWADQDPTFSSNGPLVATYKLFGITTYFNGSLSSLSNLDGEHAFYVAADMEVHELNFNGSGWVDANLTILASAPLPSSSIGPASLSDPLGLKVFFIATGADVHEISTSPIGWSDADLTLSAVGQTSPLIYPYPYCSLSVLSFAPDGRTFESDVFYMGGDGSLHRLAQVSTASLWGSTWYWTISPWVEVTLISSI